MGGYLSVLLVVVAAGCATATPPRPQVAATQPATPQPAASTPAAAKPADKPVTTTTPEPAGGSQPVATQPVASTPVATAATTPAAPPAPPQPARAAAAPPAVKTPVPQVARNGAAASAAAPKPAAPSVAAPRAGAALPAAAPPLDLEALKARLRATKAIGVFTKLSLKNKVDDLMKQFTAHYQGSNPPIAELRLSYDLLMMKVLTLLQDGDPPLATAVVSSREAIWALLADEKKFAALQS